MNGPNAWQGGIGLELENWWEGQSQHDMSFSIILEEDEKITADQYKLLGTEVEKMGKMYKGTYLQLVYKQVQET